MVTLCSARGNTDIPHEIRDDAYVGRNVLAHHNGNLVRVVHVEPPHFVRPVRRCSPDSRIVVAIAVIGATSSAEPWVVLGLNKVVEMDRGWAAQKKRRKKEKMKNHNAMPHDFAQASPDSDRHGQWVALLSGLYDSEADVVFQAAAAAGLNVTVLAEKFGVPLPPDQVHGAIQADSSQGGESLSALATDGTHLKKSASNDEIGETPEDAQSSAGRKVSASREGAKAGVVLLAIVLKSLRKYAPDIFSSFTEDMATRTKNHDFANAFITTFAMVMKFRFVLLNKSRRPIQPQPPVSPLDCVLGVMVKEGRAVTDEEKERVRNLFVDQVVVYAYEYTRESPNSDVTFKRALYEALNAMHGLDKFWKDAISKLSLLQMLVKACVLLVDELRERINARRSGTRVTRSDFSKLIGVVFSILEEDWPRPMLVYGLVFAVQWLSKNCSLLQTLLPLVTTDLESSRPGELIPPFHVATLFHLVWDDGVKGTIPGGWLYIAHTDSGYVCRFWSTTSIEHANAIEILGKQNDWLFLKLIDATQWSSAGESPDVLWLEDISDMVVMADQPILPANLNNHIESLYDRFEPVRENIDVFTFELLAEIQRFCTNNCFTFCRRLLEHFSYDPMDEFVRGKLRS
ncbi:hypothetical protein HK405_006816 [Cladochytrium tenue]|nr:hypothetical protein HK405_006816 [Cladochytrium tenue]